MEDGLIVDSYLSNLASSDATFDFSNVLTPYLTVIKMYTYNQL